MTRIYLPKRIKRTVLWVGLGVWLSGVGWLITHYWLKDSSALELGGHPSEPWWLKIHGALAFFSLWTMGLLWGLHVPKAWSTHRQRLSGGSLFTLTVVLALSGYLLYYVADDAYRQVISAAHWLAGLTLPLVYLIHRLTKRYAARARM